MRLIQHDSHTLQEAILQTQCTDYVCCFTCIVLSRPKSYRPRSDRHAPLTIHMCLLQMIYHVLVFAFLIVIASTALMTPILLYAFDLRNAGWMWQHAALFSAMIAPTDAVSVSSILKKGMPTPNAASKQTNTQGPACRTVCAPPGMVPVVQRDSGQLLGWLHPVCSDKWVCVVYLQTAAFANTLHKTTGHHCFLPGTRCNNAMPIQFAYIYPFPVCKSQCTHPK